jgi:hypothetical protein
MKKTTGTSTPKTSCPPTHSPKRQTGCNRPTCPAGTGKAQR